MTLLLGAVADDFTGATDLASMLTRGGMRTILKLGVPGPDDRVRAVQERLGRERAALLVEQTLADIASGARASGIRRFVVAGKSLENAVYAAEELEETARLFLMLRGEATRFLTRQQVADLRVRFPS
ncbi:MAG: four-carbon acid sugar kinase family protein [Alphaproteobacteria bacterium]